MLLQHEGDLYDGVQEREIREPRVNAADEAAEEEPAVGVSQTALGPADVRDTPHVKSQHEDDEAEPPDDDDPWIGRTLSNVYEIEKKIGEGGMGSVYLARHVHLKKTFAIKVLIESVAGRDNAVERLKQEAISAANIDHENIVDVVNFDRTDDGAVFIVMEHLKGESLANAIGRGPVQLHRALPITYQICRALHAAHEHGIVHRDLKPENIFLTDKGGRTIVKVLDFGISKIKKAESEQVRMTKTGQLVGTPLYMSPEQARGESDIDRRVDIYAMGVIVFEMITGTPPFDGRNYFELLWKHGNEPPPSMGELNPNVYVPGAVEMVVARALDKDRDTRYQTMAELERALLDAAPDVPSLPPMASLPPEGSEKPVRRDSDFGRAKTERLNSNAELEPRRKSKTEDAIAVPSRSLMPYAVVAIGASLLLGALVYAFSNGPEPAARDETRATAETHETRSEASTTNAEPNVPETPETAPPEGIDPPTVRLELTSRPSGADVLLDGETIGQTPLEHTTDVSDTPLRFVFRRAGYLDGPLEIVPVEGATADEVRLRRRRASSSDGSGGASSFKTGL